VGLQSILLYFILFLFLFSVSISIFIFIFYFILFLSLFISLYFSLYIFAVRLFSQDDVMPILWHLFIYFFIFFELGIYYTFCSGEGGGRIRSKVFMRCRKGVVS
jgi:hypothetical protein